MPATELPVSITIGTVPCLLFPPNAIDTRDGQLAVQGTQTLSTSSAQLLDKDGASPGERREYEFVARTRAQRAGLEAFFDSVLGRKGGFWMPSWDWDLRVAPYNNLADLYLYNTGYATYLFPLGANYRRFIAFQGPRYSAAVITAAVENDPVTGIVHCSAGETNVSSDPGAITVARPWIDGSGVRVMWLRYVRFDEDALTLETFGDGCGIGRISVVELPDEANTL